MRRRVFFSFHYENDIVRVSRIRHSGLLKDRAQTFLDKADWETIKQKGDYRIKDWIDTQMLNTSVVIVCIGKDTHARKWVKYEIDKAYKEKRGIVGIHLNGMKGFHDSRLLYKGHNPLDDYEIYEDFRKMKLSEKFKTYSWNDNDGYNNIENWIEEAYKIAGRQG